LINGVSDYEAQYLCVNNVFDKQVIVDLSTEANKISCVIFYLDAKKRILG